MVFNYFTYILNKTKYIDPRIENTDLYNQCYDEYIQQVYNNCECSVSIPDIFMFNSKSSVDVGVKRDVLSKRVIQVKGDYCLTYSETRQFTTKHNIVNLDIEIEFLLGEKIKISASKKSYGIILKADHYKVSEIDNSYIPYAHIPTIAVEDFHLIPFGEIFAGCYPETIEMFEDYYSGSNYPKKVLKK